MNLCDIIITITQRVWHLNCCDSSSQFQQLIIAAADVSRTLHHRILCEVTETTLSVI